MIDRIKKIIEEYKLSPTIFSEKIGIQKANVSHVLNGRNKPSLDFVLKISEAFPEINIEWILKGKGSMKIVKNTPTPTPSPTLFSTPKIEEIAPQIPKETEPKNTSNTSLKNIEESELKIEPNEKVPKNKKQKISSKEMKKVILLYDDNTFDYFDKNNED